MIPKKIHYCWLSNDPLPEKLQECIDSWKKYLPDYEIVKWDLNRFPLDKSNWVKQAFETKKYAFAADYIRLYALSTEGGIYLDSDVEVLKPFDDLLGLKYFICKENSPQGIEAAIIGAEKDCSWVKTCFEQYIDKDFIDSEGKMRTEVLPHVIKCTLEKNYKLVGINSPSEFIEDEDTVCYLPHDYFSPKDYVTKKISVTDNTYCIHHFAGTWHPAWKRFLLNIWVPFSVKFPALANMIKPQKGKTVRD